MIAITGATGLLGRHVITSLLKNNSASEIVAIVRNPAKAQPLNDIGVQVRTGDYNDVTTLNKALLGIDKMLFISSSEVGRRVPQHRNVITAAKAAGVELVVYTSLLHADSSPLGLAAEHIETEEMLAASGLPYVLLRNGWYSENYLASLPAAIKHGTIYGCAGEGKIASATRADYAEAAARVLMQENQAGRVYELAGDNAWTLHELATALSRHSGKPVAYQNLSEADYAASLIATGLPEALSKMQANSEAGAAKGGLFDNGHQLSQLIGRATTSLDASLQALCKQGQYC